ncbi:MAG: hypothetical protein PUP91_17930 [Rhizonema sp. PD37]|nr:hypothetical protein [Rhizonema sp. PD37]
MTTKLNCSVCGYTDIEGNNCPNCDTDLSLLRMLQQLPLVMSCPGEDLCLTQTTGGADEDAEMQRGFYDQPLGHVLKAEGVISGYNSNIKDYLFQEVGAVFNRFAQGRIALWLGVILFILTVSVGLGVVGCFLYSNLSGTSALVVLSNSPQDDCWKASTLHWLLRT